MVQSYFGGNFKKIKTDYLEGNQNDLYTSIREYEKTIAVGKVQSGKTKNLIELVKRITSEEQWIIVYLTGMDKELKFQNKSRFSKEFESNNKVYIIGDKTDEGLINDINRRLENGSSLVVNFIKQNTSNFVGWINSINEDVNILIIDDEADEGSTGEKISSEIEIINELLPEKNKKRYLSITATPYKNLYYDKYNDFDNFVKLSPYDEYKGHNHFFENYICKTSEEFESDDYLINLLIKWANKIYENDMAESQILFNHSGINDNQKKLSDKIYDLLLLKSNFDEFVDRYPERKDEILIAKKFYFGDFIDTNNEYFSNHFNLEKDLIVFNSDENEEFYTKEDIKNRENYNEGYKIIIGGNKLSRGITFNHLMIESIYYPIKTKYNAGTLIQKARWFGNRKHYKEMEIYMLSETKEAFKKIYELEEWLFNEFDIKAHNFKDEFQKRKFDTKLKVSE